MSGIARKLRRTASGKDIRPESSKKQRFIDATKSLLDIANESADAFPPLKSCLGGINALVKYYEGCKDVEEKLGDLVLWLTKLKDGVSTANADNNREGVERREQLARSLEDIEKRSQTLLNKGRGKRILDKRQDSGMAAKLVEELQRTILLYQLSQQRSIDNQVTQLTSSFGAFLKLREKSPEIKEKTEAILARLDRLTVESSTPGDGGESKRKMVLFEALEKSKDKLVSILERVSAAEYQETDTDAHAVVELAEGVTDAVMEYQLGQQRAVYEQNCRMIDSADLSVLNSCRRAQAAEYRHGNRRGCLKGTRDTVLNEIESWTRDFDEPPVFWLNGIAGTGKSTIAQSIAERLFAEGILGASFFCSRDFEDRSNLQFIFPTLAFQLAHRYPGFRSQFLSIVQSNPDIIHEPLCDQMQKLVVEPLWKTEVSMVIVIDALDECKDDEPSSAILSVLDPFVKDIPRIKFLITGRPEPRIKAGFLLPILVDSTLVFVLHDVPPSLIRNDIRLFLKHELAELARQRKLKGWPADEHIDLLCDRAAGLFVYAVATVRFLGSNTHFPKHQLDAILKLPESTAHEGKIRLNQKSTLDSLYMSILQTTFSEEDPDVDSKVRTIIGTVVMVTNPLPPPAIAELIGLEPEVVTWYLELTQSLIPLDEDPNRPVKPFHKSFPDFITDYSRCNTRFLISSEHLHSQLATNCLRLMNDELEQDLLSLPEYALNSEVQDLESRIENRVSIALQYACRSWHNHLAEIRGGIADVIPHVRIFLEAKLLAWLEVLSVLGDVRSAPVALEKLMRWLDEVAEDTQLLDTARDCFHFVTKFFEPIRDSATHIYHSALELCPISSIVRKLYYDQCHGITRFPRVVVGTPDTWGPTVSASSHGDYNIFIWSPCGQFVAARTRNVVEIRNHLTLELLTILQYTGNTKLSRPSLAYSPDGRFIACESGSSIVIWDIQTGGVAKEINCRRNIVSLVWSLDGRTIAVTHGYEHSISGAGIYDVASGKQLFTVPLGSGNFYHLWACEESFRLMTIRSHFTGPSFKISIFDIRPALTEVNSFVVTMQVKPLRPFRFAFSPSTYRVSILGSETLHIFDIRTSDCLLEENGIFSRPQFSSDGNLFAAPSLDGLHIWKYTSGSYILLGESPQRTPPSAFSFRLSPTPASSSILYQFNNRLQLSRSHDPLTPLKTRRDQTTTVSRSGSHIAIANRLGSTVTIIDINSHSQAPSQLIDTGVKIDRLIVTGNVLLVVGFKEVVAWLLTEKGTVDDVFDNRRADRSHSVWTAAVNRFSIPAVNSLKTQEFHIEGQVAEIRKETFPPFIYHTGTGKVLKPVEKPQPSGGTQRILYSPSGNLGTRYLRYRNLSHYDPLKDSVPNERITLGEEGWIIDTEGRHRFWLPAEWRERWDRENWLQDIMTLFIQPNGHLVIIKF